MDRVIIPITNRIYRQILKTYETKDLELEEQEGFRADRSTVDIDQ